MLLDTFWATNELEAVLPLIQGACFFLCTQLLQVLFEYFFFIFQMSALISPQTRMCFDIVLFLNYELMAIQPPSAFFTKSYFSSELFLTIQFTQLSSTLRKWPLQGTNTSATVGLSSARPLGRGQLTNTVSQARASFPFSNRFIFLQFTVGCKPGLCRVGHKWVQVRKVSLNFKLLWSECKVE